MSSSPFKVPKAPNAQQQAAQQKHSRTADVLYIVGACLVTIGVGLHAVRFGLIAAGTFCLLLPALELAAGFISGLRGK
jgi:hypothetical protein